MTYTRHAKKINVFFFTLWEELASSPSSRVLAVVTRVDSFGSVPICFHGCGKSGTKVAISYSISPKSSNDRSVTRLELHLPGLIMSVFSTSKKQIDWVVADDDIGDLRDMDMLFDPHLAQEPPCPCEGVDRCVIVESMISILVQVPLLDTFWYFKFH